MNLGKLESQIHDSGKVGLGESWLFMGFMTPDEPDFSTIFSPKRLFFDSDVR